MTPNFFDHVRELRAKMIAGTLTPRPGRPGTR